jgi:hypothetical protein
MAQMRPDVVHIVTEGPLGWSALIAARRLEHPVSSGLLILPPQSVLRDSVYFRGTVDGL